MSLVPNEFGDPGVVLRALKTIALANGEVSPLEHELLATAASVADPRADVSSIEPIDPKELAHAVSDAEQRLHILQACVVMALADGEASKCEAKALDAFRIALQVEDGTVKMFKRLARGQRRLAGFEMMRRLGEPIVKKVLKA